MDKELHREWLRVSPRRDSGDFDRSLDRQDAAMETRCVPPPMTAFVNRMRDTRPTLVRDTGLVGDLVQQY